MDYYYRVTFPTLSKLSVLVAFGVFILMARTEGSLIPGPPPKGPEPQFADVIPNVTVAAGRNVTLPCVVDNLGEYKVAWMHTDQRRLLTLLTVHDQVITRNPRYRITHNNFRTWWLQILNVNETDTGHYICQVNTSPMKNLVGLIQVVVPPRISENVTSSDTDVREGSDVSLRCQATGSPQPQVKWRREDEKEITIGVKKVPTVEGTYLNITKTSRLHMAAYLCIASNGIPPAVSKRIMLNVNFAPMIWIPNQLVGAAVGSDVTLDCHLESHPRAVTYWTREKGGGLMILSNIKYGSVLLDTGAYKVQMRLVVRRLLPEDFGSYTCVAKNSLGETEGTIRLYEIPKPHSSTYPSKNGLASSRAEGAPQATGEKIVLTWPKDGFEDERMQDVAKGDLEKRESYSSVTVYAGSELGDGKPNGNDATGVCSNRWTMALQLFVPLLVLHL